MNIIERTKGKLSERIKQKIAEKLSEEMGSEMKGAGERYAAKLDPKLKSSLKPIIPQLRNIIKSAGGGDQKADIAMHILQSFGFTLPELESIRVKLGSKIQKLSRDIEEPGQTAKPKDSPEDVKNEVTTEAYDLWFEKVQKVSGVDTLSRKMANIGSGALKKLSQTMPALVRKQPANVKVDLALQTIEALLGIPPAELARDISRFTSRAKEYAKGEKQEKQQDDAAAPAQPPAE